MKEEIKKFSKLPKVVKYKVLAPLSEFYWDGDNYMMHSLLKIKRFSSIPDLQWCKKLLSNSDITDIGMCNHWIVFEQNSTEDLSTSQKINIFLFALWLVWPTRSHVRFRFEFPHQPLSNRETSSATRYLDRFQWNKTDVQDNFLLNNLKQVSILIPKIKSIYEAKGRLMNGIVLTFQGCTTKHWQSAFICFSAAAEAVLTYEKGRGITDRLARSYACLTETDKTDRDSAYSNFSCLYNVRSDLMHGRGMIHDDSRKNLIHLAEFSDLLRKLWVTILTSEDGISELEKDDIDRESWFGRIERGYCSPKIRNSK